MLISISTKKLPFYKDCTQFSRRDTEKDGGLNDMIDNGKDVTYKTFRSHVDTEEFDVIARNMGYNKNFKIEDDYAVSFKRSKLFGKPAYYMVHSSIEYIFWER